MAKRKAKKLPVPVPVPADPPAAAAAAPPEGEYHTITSLAALCGVTEQTVRRWLWYETIPAPKRYGRLQWWPKSDAEAIAQRYLTSGSVTVPPARPLTEGKP